MQEGRAWHAWTTAALGRVQKMPSLDSLTGRRRPVRPQTAEEQMAIFEMWNVALGGEVVSPADT